jgi:hypothetical protein
MANGVNAYRASIGSQRGGGQSQSDNMRPQRRHTTRRAVGRSNAAATWARWLHHRPERQGRHRKIP